MNHTEIPERIAIVDKALNDIFEEFSAYPELHNMLSDSDFEDELIELHIQVRAHLYGLLIADEQLLTEGKKRIRDL